MYVGSGFYTDQVEVSVHDPVEVLVSVAQDLLEMSSVSVMRMVDTFVTATVAGKLVMGPG
jgi:hypothetical protein